MERIILVEDVAQLLARLAPVIEKSDDSPFLHPLEGGKLTTGTERQRQIYRETGSWRAVLDAMMHGWTDELEAVTPGQSGLHDP
jgi:hypothetical protein